MWVMILHHRVLAQISMEYSIPCVVCLGYRNRGKVNKRMFSPWSVHLHAVQDKKIAAMSTGGR
jgi:hypothetical protein